MIIQDVEHTYEDVKEVFSNYIHNPDDVAEIHRAYLFAEEKHRGQLRKSGKPYVSHVIEVAYILATLQAGPSTIIAGFLHDTIEDCGITKEDIEKQFSSDIANIVEALTKIKKLSKIEDQDFRYESHRKIFIAMAKDIRVIIIKLADRLHNMRTLQYQSPEKQQKIASETLEVYAPIAHRLGINTIKSELEDLCLYYLHPDKYQEIEDLLNSRTKNRKEAMRNLKKKIADLLIKTGIPFEIESRVKQVYSIYKKMYFKHRPFEQIYDIMALRIITETELNCYEILGYIHSVYTAIPGRFKDYITMPKPNMYQSLHTTIIGKDGNIFEIQIRTKEMDEIAESGVAAHWRYKENSKYDARKEQREIEEKLHWFADFVSMTGEHEDDAKEYMKTLTHDIFDANVYVFTPKGKVIDLPSGSTPLDFAYRIHSDVGDFATGAVVNNTLVPLSYELKTGDVVEIKTSKNSQGPNEGWLKIVKTNVAKSRIKKFLQRKNADFIRDDNIQKGHNTLIDVAREYELGERQILERIDDEVLKNFNVLNLDELYLAIASRKISPTTILEFLGFKKETKEEMIKAIVKRPRKYDSSSEAIQIKGASKVMINLASCCTPIPGDEIVGYITKGKGIKVHRTDCPNIAKNNPRLIDVKWNPNLKEATYPIDIALDATDRNNLLLDVMSCLSSNKISCTRVSTKSHPNKMTVTIETTILVSNNKNYQAIRNSLINIDGIYDVRRVTH